ncbi:MAG TPA: hypothetical protein VFH27_00375, partial [Longimicrobiaceae bacterium]|nr:hypothetical protein [Longimicrobiaceae bacterium]
QLYSYRGRAGEHLSVTLVSKAFDAYLAIGRMDGGEFKASESDDDSGGGTDAKVEYTLPADGEYLIRANTLAADETGAFTLTVTAGPAPAAAQSPSTGRAGTRGSVAVGQTVRSTLSASDPKASDNSYYQLWTFQGRAGQTVTIDLRSDDFDVYLGWGRVTNGSFVQSQTDDDGGGGTNARLVVTPTADGTYAIRANTLSAGETGAYTLSVTAGGAAAATQSSTPSSGSSAVARPAIVGSITAGRTLSGTLSTSDAKMGDDSYYRDYTYQGRAGERITITFRSSDFDTYLHFGKLSGQQFQSLDTDDDGAGGTDSKIERVLTEDGTYVIRANALAANTVGAFTLSVTSTR